MALKTVGGVPESPVSEQLTDQVGRGVAWFSAFEVVGGGLGARLILAGGREESRLDFEQRGGSDEELASGFDIDLLEVAQVVQVLVGDVGDGDLGDIHLGPANQKEQQVEGTLEVREPDCVVFGEHWEPGRREIPGSRLGFGRDRGP